MGIYGNIPRSTILEYCITEEQKVIESMLPSLNESVNLSINEGKAWDIIKGIFEKIKKFFGFLKEKIAVLIDKIKRFLNKLIGNNKDHENITTHYPFFSEKEKKYAKEITIDFKEYEVQNIINFFKSDYLSSINDIWDKAVDIMDKDLNKSSMTSMKEDINKLKESINKFSDLTESIKGFTGKDVSIPCIDGLSKAAIQHNNWFRGTDSINHDLNLHVTNLTKSEKELSDDIKELEAKVNKYNTNEFKDNKGNVVDLKDNIIFFQQYQLSLNNIINIIGKSLTEIARIDSDMEQIPGKINKSLSSIKYAVKESNNRKEQEKVD